MSDRDSRLSKILLVAFFALIVVRNAWVSDDAYITFRTIENFLAGYGLGYNPDVRVQAYTHPLWMFLLAFLYRLQMSVFPHSANALYYVTVFTSIAVSILAVWWLLRRVVGEDLWTVVFLVAALTLSRAFVDFSTSGLENPLTHLLLALFVWIYFTRPNKLFLLTLTSSLLFLNRQDIILLVAPALLLALWINRREPGSLKAVLLGGLPVIVWELFSILYYGFPFPNTAYAKLNTGVEAAVLLQQGGDYLLNSLNWDPLTLFVIVCAGVVVFLGESKAETWHLRVLYLGVVLYLLYVVKIGGDFMSGRFLTAPLLVSAVALARSSLPRNGLLAVTGIVAMLGIVSVRSTLLDPLMPMALTPSVPWTENPLTLDENGVADERAVYFANESDNIYLGLVAVGFRGAEVGSEFAGQAWEYSGTRRAIYIWSAGRDGYMRGPNIHIVDKFALTDPILARLPITAQKWRIGHFARDLPEGYLDALGSGVNQIVDPSLAQYYDELNAVIRGPLWSRERLLKIWKFNTGQYDHLIENYLQAR